MSFLSSLIGRSDGQSNTTTASTPINIPASRNEDPEVVRFDLSMLPDGGEHKTVIYPFEVNPSSCSPKSESSLEFALHRSTESPTHQTLIDVQRTMESMNDQLQMIHEDQLRMDQTICELTSVVENALSASAQKQHQDHSPTKSPLGGPKLPTVIESELEELPTSSPSVSPSENEKCIFCEERFSELKSQVDKMAVQMKQVLDAVGEIADSLRISNAVARNRKLRTGAVFGFEPEHTDAYYRRPAAQSLSGTGKLQISPAIWMPTFPGTTSVSRIAKGSALEAEKSFSLSASNLRVASLDADRSRSSSEIQSISGPIVAAEAAMKVAHAAARSSVSRL